MLPKELSGLPCLIMIPYDTSASLPRLSATARAGRRACSRGPDPCWAQWLASKIHYGFFGVGATTEIIAPGLS